MDKKKGNSYRFIFLIVFIVIFFIACLVQLFNLQIIHGNEKFEESNLRLYKTRVTEAPRGEIIDANGKVLASVTKQYNIILQHTSVSFDEFNESLLVLVNIFNLTNENYNDSFMDFVEIDPLTFKDMNSEEIIEWQKDKNIFNFSDNKVILLIDDFFSYLRNRSSFFKIDSSYSDEDAYKIFILKYEILKKYWSYLSGETITIAEDVSEKTIAMIEEQFHKLPGIIIETIPIRKYSYDVEKIAHVLGYVSKISSEEMEAYDNYTADDYIGKTGVEKSMETFLKGTDGEVKYEVDLRGRLTSQLDEIEAVPGCDVQLTIDMRLQDVVMRSLESNIEYIKTIDVDENFNDANAGAAVVIDIKTGAVLALASYPSFDPSNFVYSTDFAQDKVLEYLNDEENMPLYNRAIQFAYTPGSTFKPLVGIAGLMEGIITPDETIECTGITEIGGKEFFCYEFREYGYTHGKINIQKALETSCNIFFHVLGARTGIDNISKWANAFGLGVKTGIDLLGEATGMCASREYKMATFNEDWWIADTAQAAIGQLYNSFTPIQLAVYAAAIANDGNRVTPYVIDQVVDSEGNVVFKTKAEIISIPIDKDIIGIIKDGMRDVTLEGTAKNVFENFPISVAGKTGTAETGFETQNSSNALFICYAPVENPEIAIAVVVEHGVWGSFTAPIAKDILEYYFNIK